MYVSMYVCIWTTKSIPKKKLRTKKQLDGTLYRKGPQSVIIIRHHHQSGPNY